MKKLLLIPMLGFLAACGHDGGVKPELGIAPPPQMPDIPDSFKQRAERLPNITDPTLGGIHTDGTNTDIRYNNLAHRYNSLIDIWGCVRSAMNERSPDGTADITKMKTELDTCLIEAEPGK